jgi:hypothetical protein
VIHPSRRAAQGRVVAPDSPAHLTSASAFARAPLTAVVFPGGRQGRSPCMSILGVVIVVLIVLLVLGYFGRGRLSR